LTKIPLETIMLLMFQQLINGKFGVTAGKWPIDPDKTTIVFVHGATASHMMWIPQLVHFRKEYNTIAVDLPGHGLSPGPAFKTVSGYADFVLAAADALKIGRFILVGLSMGGAISQQIALNAPDRLIALVLMSTGVRLRVMPELFKTIRENWPGFIELFPSFALSKNASKIVIEASKQELRKMTPSVAECDFYACDAFDVKEKVKGIKLTTLIVSASEDVLTPPKYSDYLSGQIAGSRLVRIENAGHVVNLEKPQEVNKVLEEFFNQLPVKS